MRGPWQWWYGLQAFAILGWWLLLWLFPDSRAWFVPADMSWGSFSAFAPGDVLLLAGGAALVCRGFGGNAGQWFLAGASWWPTLACAAWALSGSGPWLSVFAMVGLAGLNTVAAQGGDRLHRLAVARPPWVHALRTLIQITVFWGLFLWILPLTAAEIEQALGFSWQPVGWLRGLGWLCFVAAGCLGLASAWALAIHGHGTPLPCDAPPRLIMRGPYRFVRNPMALAGLIQGLGTGVIVGAISMPLWVLFGGLLWHCMVRPQEEADLLQRFGDNYRAYRRSTPLWFPRRTGDRPSLTGVP